MDFITVVLLIVFFVSIFWILIAILTKKKYKIPIVVSISSLVLVFILQGLQVDKEGKKPVTPAKTKEEMGIDISGKNEEQRIQEAMNVIAGHITFFLHFCKFNRNRKICPGSVWMPISLLYP